MHVRPDRRLIATETRAVPDLQLHAAMNVITSVVQASLHPFDFVLHVQICNVHTVTLPHNTDQSVLIRSQMHADHQAAL